jgi:hypothetical protein
MKKKWAALWTAAFGSATWDSSSTRISAFFSSRWASMAAPEGTLFLLGTQPAGDAGFGRKKRRKEGLVIIW